MKTKKFLTILMSLLSTATIALTTSVLVQCTKNNITTISEEIDDNFVKNGGITKDSSCKKINLNNVNGSSNDKKSFDVRQVEFGLKEITLDAFRKPDDATKPDNIIAIKEITDLKNDKGFIFDWTNETAIKQKSIILKTYISENYEKFFNKGSEVQSIDNLKFDFSKSIAEDDDSKTFIVKMRVTTTDGSKYFFTSEDDQENVPGYTKKISNLKIKLKKFNSKKWTEAVGTKIQEVFKKAIEEEHSVRKDDIKNKILAAINVDEILNFIPDGNISCNPESDVKKFDETSFAEINLNWISLANKFNDNYGKVIINDNNVITLKMENFKDSYTSFGAGWVFDTSDYLLIPKIDKGNFNNLVDINISNDNEIKEYSISEIEHLYIESKNDPEKENKLTTLIMNIILNHINELFQGPVKDNFDFNNLQFRMIGFKKNINEINIKIELILNETTKIPYIYVDGRKLYYKHLEFNLTGFKDTPNTTTLKKDTIDFTNGLDNEETKILAIIFQNSWNLSCFKTDWLYNKPEFKSAFDINNSNINNIDNILKNKAHSSEIKGIEWNKNNTFSVDITFSGHDKTNTYNESITETINIILKDDPSHHFIDKLIQESIQNIVNLKDGQFISKLDEKNIKQQVINKLNDNRSNLPQTFFSIQNVEINFDKIDTTKNPMIVQSGAITITGNNGVRLSNTTNLEISQENNQTTLIKDVVDANTELDIIQTIFSSANDKGFAVDWKLEHEQDQLVAKINNLKQNLIQNKESYFNNIPTWFEVKNVSLKTCDFDNNKLIFNIEYNGYVQERTTRGIQNTELTINLKSTTDAINNVFGEEYDKVINDIINNSSEAPTSDSFKESITDYLESNKNNLPDSMIPADGNFDKDDIKINWDKVQDNEGVISFPEGSIEIINTRLPINIPPKKYNYKVENETSINLEKNSFPLWAIILIVVSLSLTILIFIIVLFIRRKKQMSQSV